MQHFGTEWFGTPPADYIVGELNRARGPDTAYYLSHALHSLQDHARVRRTPLLEADAASIIGALDAATPEARALFSVWAEGAFAFQAMGKAKALVRHWAEAPGGLDRGTLHNALSYVVWLRNHCHNLSLLDEIEAYHTGCARKRRQTRLEHRAADAQLFEGPRRPRITQF